MGSNYDLLISKINEFTRKFYLNKLLRGSIFAAALILSLYLFLFVWVFYTYPSIAAKTFLFYSFMGVSLVAILFWIIRPALSYFKLSKTLSLEEASNLIGLHFFNVKDKLLNTLQLKELAANSPQNSALILAGIDQKIKELKPVPFATAINLADNKKHIKYIALPLFIILLIGVIAPAILREGTNSFIRYNEEILPKAPFNFVVENKSLNITQGDDLTIKVKLTGNEFPQDIYLEDGVNSYKLEKQDISHFSYTIKNIQKDKVIRFNGGGFNSTSHTISVKPRPSLLNLSATLVYPPYLNRKSEEIPNVGDLLLPEGTKVNWKLKTENSDEITFILQQKVHPLAVVENSVGFSATIKQNGNYQIVPKNKFVSLRDSLSHQLTVIKDQFPTIAVTETPDSLSSKALYFTGVINDDYGFSSLKFKYQIKDKNKVVGSGTKVIAIKNQQTENNFFYLWNINEVAIKPGQTIDYFFEVADNDGVNGAKIMRSEIKTYQAPTPQQIAEKLAEGSQSLKQKMEQTIKLANSIEKDSKKLSENLLDKKQLNFEDKKQIEQLLDKQKQLDQAVKDIKELNEKNNFDKQENAQLNEELKEKQKKIDELFNNVLDEKTKELLQKLQQLMDQNNKDQTRNELSKMQLDNKSVKNELDRILELYKQLEFEQNLQNKIDRLNELAKEQKGLSEQSKNNNLPMQDLKGKQDQLNKDFRDLKKELQDLDKKNQALERPNNYKNPEKETNDIEKSQQDGKEELNQNNRQKASEKQQQAGEQMQQLAQQMQEQQQTGAEEENKVNAQELRKLLENLLSTSFEQEKVMVALRKMGTADPTYVAQAQKQNMIRDNMKTIADSLFSLSKRVPQIESTVSTEVEKINFNIAKAIDFLGDRRTSEANRSQQFAMTSLNNLALMLNEALEQLQNAMKNAKGGKGKQKQGMQQLQQMQEQLNKNMQQAKEKMEREGNMGTVPKGQMSQEFAKMAQQQQMIREALEKINKEDNKDGKGSLGNLNQAIQEMKQSELDLVNKRITQETINRQKNLMVKLLDAEKAQREQDQDEKRESNAAKQFPPSYQKNLEKFNKSMQSESELIQKLPPNLNYYYKNKVAEYFKLLNSGR
ncbi:ATPase [Pedobacter sp.]